jgi:hypothetical protein
LGYQIPAPTGGGSLPISTGSGTSPTQYVTPSPPAYTPPAQTQTQPQPQPQPQTSTSLAGQTSSTNTATTPTTSTTQYPTPTTAMSYPASGSGYGGGGFTQPAPLINPMAAVMGGMDPQTAGLLASYLAANGGLNSRLIPGAGVWNPQMNTSQVRV